MLVHCEWVCACGGSVPDSVHLSTSGVCVCDCVSLCVSALMGMCECMSAVSVYLCM